MDTANLSDDQLKASFIVKNYCNKTYPNVKTDDMSATDIYNNVFTDVDRTAVDVELGITFATKEA